MALPFTSLYVFVRLLLGFNYYQVDNNIQALEENSDFTNRAPLAGLGVVTGCGHHGKMNIWGRMRSSFQLKTRAPPVCWTPT
ncbi:hypothetical protein PSHT_09979 [Puccinia striiformis]|uniref:Uncharacterized protein n=1 Tax=Puccinia striiformis TaxID=27350 RepID=A0A2S4VCU8_9BASI|nr:hypothetical protein PSHT_09979 [Puccinia striiformis]